MRGHLNLVAAGFCLTALTYGLARFAFGLLLPDISAELSLSATAAGWIGGGAFAAYCVGIVFASTYGAQYAERTNAILAAGVATGGLALAAMASSAVTMGLAIALAGLSTGLTSPPMAAAVARAFAPGAQAKANGAINSGTAAGIVLSGIAVLSLAIGWRQLYAAFAAAGLVVTIWLWFAIPAGRVATAATALPLALARQPGIAGLTIAAFLMGAGSTAVWTFGATILRQELTFDDSAIALAWIVLGVAGTGAVATGLLTDRFGVGLVHRISVSAMALALGLLALAGADPALAFAAMAVFGLAYIVSSGAFLLWGIALLGDRPALGLGYPFLVLALGQTAGAPLFGMVYDLAGSGPALGGAALAMAASAIPVNSRP
ncbi:YbfB/YjiJ family MFS transporter [Aureimonas altamirensis]|uniref:MFS transporter n=1 Tax=Aureimonas altamirensis TaxID=370622 RepID=UPI002036C6D4|nr:YbfB/YjiJ family MFS transporter [Aureimonas altamirensis]